MTCKKNCLTIAAVIAAFTVLALASCGTMTGGSRKDGIKLISLNEAIQQSAQKISAKLPEQSRVVILAFDSYNEGLSNYIMEQLAGSLVNNKIEVADRQSLEYIFKELNFQISWDVSDESAQAIGKFLGAQLVISGVLTDVEEAYRFRTSAIQVETAAFLSVPRFNVRNDSAMRNMASALAKQKPAAETPKYRVSEQTAPQTAGVFLDRGIMFAARKEFDAAIADFTQAIKINPKLAGAYILRGRALAEKSKASNQAVSDFNEAIRLDPNNAVAHNERGMVVHQLADYNRALEDYTRAIQLNPDFAEAYFNRGDTHFIRKEFDQAIEDYTQAIQLNPKNKYPYMERASVYRILAEYDLAIADYTSVIGIDSNFIKAYMERGGTYREREIDLEMTSTFYIPNYNRSIADFTRVIKTDSNYADAYSGRALTYTSKKDYNRAIADLNMAIQIEPDNKHFYKYRGDVYMEKKDYNLAIEDYEAAQRIDPNDVVIKRSLQRARQELGR
jgi:tetratricopeptide (TPR) repeat protein